MASTVSCSLPPAVESYLVKRYSRPAFSILLEAAKNHTKQRTSLTASAEVGRLAVQHGCTKTDIYRLALIKFDSSIESLWPPRRRTPAQISTAHSQMLTPIAGTPPSPNGKAKLIAALRAFHADVANMSTPQIRERLDTIINKLER